MRIDCANTITITPPSDGHDCTHLQCGVARSQARAHEVRTAVRVTLVRLALASIAALALTRAASAGPASSVPASAGLARSKAPASRFDQGCLPDGSGYVRARIRGAEHVDVDWRNADLECQGSVRPGDRGLRVSFAGPLPQSGQRLRMIFGIGAIGVGRAGRELPTNVTVIFEGARRLYATLSEDKCTIDRLQQIRIARRNGVDVYRVVARGFCFEPLTDLIRNDRIVMSRFDFAGRIAFASPSS